MEYGYIPPPSQIMFMEVSVGHYENGGIVGGVWNDN